MPNAKFVNYFLINKFETRSFIWLIDLGIVTGPFPQENRVEWVGLDGLNKFVMIKKMKRL